MAGAITVVLLIAIAFVFVLLMKAIYIIKQAEALVVERLGKYHRTCHSGLQIIIPILDDIRPFKLEGRSNKRIDLREQVMDFPPQPVITHDNVTMQVDSVIYYQISDPVKSVYNIEDISLAIRQLAITNMRNVMGEMDLDETLTSRETVNTKLRMVLDEATDKWGVKVTRVELKNILPPAEIEEAMAKQMKAERERRATVTEAEGRKRAAILSAEGDRDAAIAEAEGDKKAKILRAEADAAAIEKVAIAEAEAIRQVFKGIHEGKPTKGLIAIKYLETLQKIADGRSTKIFVPYETAGILGAAGSLASIMKEKEEG
jgi:regulator of protease activity HflC (stomatin/prohibitin superfamily)